MSVDGSGAVDDGGLGGGVVEAEDLGASIWARTWPSSARTNAYVPRTSDAASNATNVRRLRRTDALIATDPG